MDKELAVIPYKDIDTITFIKTNTNDTFTFYANKWQYGYYKSTTSFDCYNYENREIRIINFYNSQLKTSIKIEQFIPQNSQYTSYFNISFNGTSYVEYSSYLASSGSQLDSLSIQNKTFQKVYYFDNSIFVGTKNYKCYYTKDYGIIKMELANGETLELITNK